MKVNKVKAGFSLESQTIERLEKLAQITRLSKSAIVDSAIEDWYRRILEKHLMDTPDTQGQEA